jgi:hypothetical protein
MPIENRPFDVEKELDAVVGPYEAAPRERMVVRAGRIALRVLIGACFAIATAAAVVYTLHTHVKQAQTAPPPKKPVSVTIIPAK